MKKDTRRRNFATIVYPDSAPDNWLKILDSHHVPACVSPLHDEDVYDEDVIAVNSVTGKLECKYRAGVLKKPHYHVMFMFKGNKSDEQVRDIFDSFGGVGLEVINDLGAYARYLCHLDDDDKVTYDCESVLCFGGSDYFTLIDIPAEKYNHISDMMNFCMQNEVYSFSELSIYAMVHRRDWFRILVDKSTVYMKEWLKSRMWDMERKSLRHVDDAGNLVTFDPTSGDIIDA